MKKGISIALCAGVLVAVGGFLYNSWDVRQFRPPAAAEHQVRSSATHHHHHHINNNKDQEDNYNNTMMIGTQPTRPSNLWIYAEVWHEGMAGWKETFTELLSLAYNLKATLVEPCLAGGKRIGCGLFLENNNKAVMADNNNTPVVIRLGDMFDLHRARTHFYPHIATYEEFLQAQQEQHSTTAIKTFPACLKKGGTCPVSHLKHMIIGGNNINLEHYINTTFQQKEQPDLDSAIQYSQEHPNTMTIIAISDIRKNSLRLWKRGTGRRAHRLDNAFSSQDLLHFPPRHYQVVDAMLEHYLRIKPGTPYAALQWRPEVMRDDYMPCAHAILEARDIILQQQLPPNNTSSSSAGSLPFVLISPLSLVPSLQWDGVALAADASPNTSYPSLQLLLDRGFRKLEQGYTTYMAQQTQNNRDTPDLLKDINLDNMDKTLWTIWEFILGQRAKVFTTCSGCDKDMDYCSFCNYQGSASKYALYLREQYTQEQEQQERGKEMITNRCWPSNKTLTPPPPARGRRKKENR
ncbi:expressed unknown protein [Seminavis robusta]|uniref:Uncharacterized protein n=1 Tax=Seminavis robusta TaxID=568900 RepID=A0A9N8E172_9STRA|nr:expressed unknown protein [Seminavis robusta]|eukprot:Sro432_g141740.1 n/a (520) ;mRNA; r:64403-65962